MKRERWSRSAESWEPRDILSNNDGVVSYLENHNIGEHEVDNTFEVGLHTEILMISTRETLANTVMVVEEGDVIVKSEMVFIDFIDESSQVDEEETFNLIHRIIKDHRAPRRMVISLSRMRIAMVGAVGVFVEACEWINSIIILIPIPCALSINYLKSSGFPFLNETQKKLVTWYPKLP